MTLKKYGFLLSHLYRESYSYVSTLGEIPGELGIRCPMSGVPFRTLHYRIESFEVSMRYTGRERQACAAVCRSSGLIRLRLPGPRSVRIQMQLQMQVKFFSLRR